MRKVLKPEDFELSISLDGSHDGEAIVFERGATGGSAQARPLCRGDVLWAETAKQVCVQRRTWITTFPGASIALWKTY